MTLSTIRAALEETHQESRALIAGLNTGDLDRRTRNPKWTVRQIAAHIAEDDGATLYVAKLLARGKNATAPGFVVNLANWWALRKYRRAATGDLLATIDQKHAALMNWLTNVPAEALERQGTISQVGRMSLAEFLVKSGTHSREHAADIRAVIVA
jgi:hypothetical protein